MSTAELFKIAGLITAFQFLFFSIFLLTHKKGRKISNRILSIFLISKFFGICNALITAVFGKYFYIHFPHAFMLGISFLFLVGPSVYFYTKSLVFQDFAFKRKDAIHLVPFLFHSVYMIFKYHIYSAEVKRNILNTGIHAPYISIIFDVGLLLLMIIYLVASLGIMSNFQNRLKEEYSNIRRVNLSWLRFLVIGLCLIWILDVSHFAINVASNSYPYKMSIVLLGFLFLYANIIVYFGLKQPEIFSGIKEKSKYKTSSLTKSQIEQYKKKLLEYMENEKPYLEPELKIQDLAADLSLHPRYLSQVINETLDQNFYDFINDYRIKEAQDQLIDRENGHRTVLEILYDVGFNAKSTFNHVFKKKTGVTPTQYRKQHAYETVQNPADKELHKRS